MPSATSARPPRCCEAERRGCRRGVGHAPDRRADRRAGVADADLERAWGLRRGRRHGEEAPASPRGSAEWNIPIVAHGCLGDLYLAQGDLAHAMRVFEQGSALCEGAGYRSGFFRVVAAGLPVRMAQVAPRGEGRTLLEEGIRDSRRTGALQSLSHRVARLSEVCRWRGCGAEARQHAHEALDLARQYKSGDEALALHQLGTVYAHADPPEVEQAEVHYQQALALAEERGCARCGSLPPGSGQGCMPSNGPA